MTKEKAAGSIFETAVMTLRSATLRGGTGDDIIALTALCPENVPPRASGALSSTHILHNDWSRRSRDIYNIILRNVMGYSKGGLW